MVPLGELTVPAGSKAGKDKDHQVFSVTKHSGFVPSAEYFKKQVFSRELDGYKRVKRGDFAYATIHLDEGSIGIAHTDGLISPMYTVFRPKEHLVDSAYLLRYLKSPAALAQYPRFGKGSVHRRKSISLDALGGLMVPLPSLKEQRRIASILEQFDVLKRQQQAELARLGQVAPAVFASMFRGVETEAVGEKLCFVTSGGRGWARYYSAQGTPFIRSLDVQMSRIASEDLAFVVAPDSAEARRTKTISGDVLLTITGSAIGRASVLPENMAGAYVSQHVAILRPDRQQIRPEYLSAFLCASGFGQDQIRAAQYGQTKPGLNFDQIRRFQIPKADLDRQDEFCEKARVAQNLVAMARTIAEKRDELELSLQSRAFSGEL